MTAQAVVDIQNSPAIQALKDAGVSDTELNEIQFKTEEPTSDSTTHNTHLVGQVEQEVKQLQRRDDDDVQVKYAVVSVHHIVQSELLTEDDLLLVASLCDYCMEKQTVQYSHSSSWLSNNYWLFTTGLVVVIAIVLCTPVIICASITIIILLLVTVYKIKCYYRMLLVRKGVSFLQDYLNHFDNLLVLFSKCLRLIQETEVISRGYTRLRLTAWTPASRIEQQGTAGYQCVVLRRFIVKVCQNLLSDLQQASINLCNNFPLKFELADYQQPLPLEDLPQEEDALSMDSLKFLIRLVALHNSALLRITALCLDGGLLLSDLPSILPTATICDAHSSLKQSFEFHRNRVFDKPCVHKSSAKQQDNFDTSLVEELTSMDIHTQMILKRLRELIDKFSEEIPDVEVVKGSLLELEGDYQLIQEQCRLTIKMVSKQQNHSSPLSSVVDINTSDSESIRSECCSSDQSNSDSSDEVFEGMASVNEDGGDDSLWQEETKEDKETSIAMIKELRNVLTIRTTNKTLKRPRRAKSKHKKRNSKVLSQSNQTDDQLSKITVPDGNTSEQYIALSSDTSTPIRQDTNTDLLCDTKNDILLTPCDTKEGKLHNTEDNIIQDILNDVPNNKEFSQGFLLEDTNPVMMRHIAAMAAKMALKQSAESSKQEEVFGSEQ